MILLNFEVFAIQLNFFTENIALRLETFIIGLFLKFLGMVKILLVYSHEFSKLKRLFFAIFNFEHRSRFFL